MTAVYIAAFVCIALTCIAVAALIVAGDADARNDARSHIGERLGGGRGVDQFHEEPDNAAMQ